MARLFGTALAIALAIGSAAQACGTMDHAGHDHSAHQGHGDSDFDVRYNLTDHTGKAATPKRFAGQYQLVFFGVTNCPDICPIGLDVIYRALDLLPEETSAKAQPILITIDPARDTADVLAEYVQYFDESLIGLTGSEEAIAEAEQAFGVLSVMDHTSHDGHYMMNHSSSIYVVGPEGQACGTTPSNISAAALKDQFAALLK